MKKRIFAAAMSAVCASALALTFPAAPADAAARLQLMGDLDGNCMVDAADAQKTLMLYVDSLADKCSGEADMVNGYADIDMDGQITAGDAQDILSYYCRTLSGKQPLWAEYRDVSYVSGVTSEGGETQKPFQKTGMYVEIGCAVGAPGETVTVPVYIAGAPLLAGFQFYLNQSGGAVLTDISADNPELYGAHSDLFINQDPDVGALIWINAGGKNASIADGTVLAYYTYRIPENAEAGMHYELSIDRQSMFVTNGTENGSGEPVSSSACAYQYTLLDGVIVVQ